MSSNNNNNNPHHDAEEAARLQAESNKRAALAGQWRTPPMPAFPTASAATTAAAKAAVAVAPPPLQVSQLPGSTEDYAKALQEAYLRGAEAAAAMAAGMPLAKSCPDFSEGGTPQAGQVVPTTASSHNPVYTNHPAPVTASSAAPKAPPPPAAVPNPLPAAPTPPPPAATGYAQPRPPPPAQQQQQQQHVSIPARAMSLPDMTTYAAQQEEEKRQKRLARNRASARLRRLRKKNLVDAYEQEVGILEKTLEQLRAHEWGKTDNAGVLAEALSMDRGQQVLDLSERQKEAANLLEQQLEWLKMLEEIMMEDYVLHQIVAGNPEVQELAASLQLSPEQLRQAEESKSGWQDEWDSLQTVKASLVALQQNEWLWNEGVGGVAEQFMSILHKNQISKFLLWADANAEAIDELDGVHASEGVPSGPVFAFGIESHPEGLNEE
eukprot:scaffold13853_cov147-Amphora_coffeaeformis.AAC.4